MSNLIIRTIAGIVYILLIVISLLMGNVAFGLLCMFILILSFTEFFKLAKKLKYNPLDQATTFAASLCFLLLILHKNNIIGQGFLFLGVTLLPLFISWEAFRSGRNQIVNAALISLSFGYILIPLSCLYLIGFYENFGFGNNFNHEILLGFFILNWSSDTGAYLTGSAIGRTKLIERISPKKTVEGSLGGLAMTMAMAYLMAKWLGGITTLDWIIIGSLITVTGTFGDLFESLLKRKAEVKDSGNIMPGHGGILDRFDSILFTAPAVFTYLGIIGA